MFRKNLHINTDDSMKLIRSSTSKNLKAAELDGKLTPENREEVSPLSGNNSFSAAQNFKPK